VTGSIQVCVLCFEGDPTRERGRRGKVSVSGKKEDFPPGTAAQRAFGIGPTGRENLVRGGDRDVWAVGPPRAVFPEENERKEEGGRRGFAKDAERGLPLFQKGTQLPK